VSLVITGLFADRRGVFKAQVKISNGVITRVAKSGLKGDDVVKIPSGCLCLPGFIDIHTHLREPGFEYKEDFETGSMAAINGGVTMLFDMPNNIPPTDSFERLKEKEKLAEKSIIPIEFYQTVGKTGFDKRLKGPFKVFLSKTTGAGNNEECIKHLKNKIVAFHCETPDMKQSSMSEILAVSKALGLSYENRITPIICHASTRGTIQLINKVRRKMRVYCEATPHHLFFTKRDKNELLTMNPPLRERRDRDYLLSAVKSGSVDFLATDHAPHTLEDKEDGCRGVPGLDTYAPFVCWLIDRGINIKRIVELTSYNASRLFSLNRGVIKKEYNGSLTILDLRKDYVVNADELKTKCGWSPFEGVSFPGKTYGVIIDGEYWGG